MAKYRAHNFLDDILTRLSKIKVNRLLSHIKKSKNKDPISNLDTNLYDYLFIPFGQNYLLKMSPSQSSEKKGALRKERP
jgi:hypothetical protein